MFNDREIVIFGAGGLLAILCLFLPVGFAGKIILGGLVLIGALILAYWRVKPIDWTLDNILRQRAKDGGRPHHYSKTGGRKISSYGQAESRPSRPGTTMAGYLAASDDDGEELGDIPVPVVNYVRRSGIAWDEIPPGKVLTIIMTVVAVYVIYWLYIGGAETIAGFLNLLW